jgi:uncharacterized protein YraI
MRVEMQRIRIFILLLLLWLVTASIQAQNIFDRPWGTDYYNNPYLAGAPVFGRSENAVGFDWGDDSPGDGIPDDNFSVRFGKGGNLPGGVYRFIITADEGFRLYIDQQVVLDRWDDHTPGSTVGRDVQLNEGYHHIQIDYREFSGRAFIYLDWGPAPANAETAPLVLAQSVPTANAMGTVTVTAASLNVRTEPRIANNVLTRVEREQQFPLLEQSPDGNWVRIAIDAATSGWVSVDYVSGSAASTMSNNSDLRGLQLRSDARLFVRIAPDAESEIVGLLPAGEIVAILGRNSAITWYQIQDGNRVGWVSAQFVTLSPDVNPVSLPIAE